MKRSPYPRAIAWVLLVPSLAQSFLPAALVLVPLLFGTVGAIGFVTGEDPGTSAAFMKLGFGFTLLFFGFGFSVNFAYAALVFRKERSRTNVVLWGYTILVQSFYAALLYSFGWWLWFGSAIALGIVGAVFEVSRASHRESNAKSI